jgi:hypothetical protein
MFTLPMETVTIVKYGPKSFAVFGASSALTSQIVGAKLGRFSRMLKPLDLGMSYGAQSGSGIVVQSTKYQELASWLAEKGVRGCLVCTSSSATTSTTSTTHAS